MANPSVSLAVWTSAWLSGRAAPDDVVDALMAWSPSHLVTAYDAVAAGRTGLSWPDMDDTGPIGLLQTVRTATGHQHGSAHITVILPAPGDARGLPAGTQFQRDAMDAGEAVILRNLVNPETAIGLVPELEHPDDGEPSGSPMGSGKTLSWTVYSLTAPASTRQPTGLAEAEYELRQAVRTATTALDQLDRVLNVSAVSPRDLVEDALRAAREYHLPAHAPERAVRVFDSADQVEAIVLAAEQVMATPGALGDAMITTALHPLAAVVRQARMAATAAVIDAG